MTPKNSKDPSKQRRHKKGEGTFLSPSTPKTVFSLNFLPRMDFASKDLGKPGSPPGNADVLVVRVCAEADEDVSVPRGLGPNPNH